MAERNPETVMADAVRNYFGVAGFWLVMLAALRSTLSGLQASILVASRVALTMARDCTLPDVLRRMHAERRTPVVAIYTGSLALVAVLFAVPNVAAAGAATSLIFLISFALAHLTSFMARRRTRAASTATFRTPLFPLVPVAGGAACAALAVFQATAVPVALLIALVRLGSGGVLYLSLFSTRARLVDAFVGATDLLFGLGCLAACAATRNERSPGFGCCPPRLERPRCGRRHADSAAGAMIFACTTVG